MSRPLFGLVLVTFLMPFVSVSCAGMTLMTVSGVDLVIGKETAGFDFPTDPWFGGSPPPSDAVVVDREPWAIAAAAIAALGMVAGVGGVGLVFGLGGIGALLALRWALLEEAGPEMMPEMMGLSLDFEWGFWLALVGFGVAAVTSVGVELSSNAGKPEKARPSPRMKDGRRSCPYCAEEIPSDSAFCQHCGNDISAVPPRVWD